MKNKCSHLLHLNEKNHTVVKEEMVFKAKRIQ